MPNKLLLYKPLIIILAISCLGAASISLNNTTPWMANAMGLFLCFLATLKLFNLKGFANFFARYDLAAARLKAYAYIYPFIELSLGLLYLSGGAIIFTNAATIAIMIVGSLGVIKVIRSGAVLECGCAGASFNLPVGRVTLFEYLAMVGMAAINLGFAFIRLA